MKMVDIDISSVKDAFSSLSQILEHATNLGSIYIDDCTLCNEGTRMLASALSRRINKSSLKSIELGYTEMYNEGVNWSAAEELIIALDGYHNLEKIFLGGITIGLGGIVSLAHMLQNPNYKLQKLDLYANNRVDQGCSTILANALAKNKD